MEWWRAGDKGKETDRKKKGMEGLQEGTEEGRESGRKGRWEKSRERRERREEHGGKALMKHLHHLSVLGYILIRKSVDLYLYIHPISESNFMPLMSPCDTFLFLEIF